MLSSRILKSGSPLADRRTQSALKGCRPFSNAVCGGTRTPNRRHAFLPRASLKASRAFPERNDHMYHLQHRFVTILASALVPVILLHGGTWTTGASMNQARDRFSGVVLPNGKVLVAGDWPAASSAELYDPAQNFWALTGNMLQGRSMFRA